jgi:succinate dehydrogenase / fumarate reductase cytochrome b subunit
MKFASRLFTSSVGKKWIVAMTGLAIIGFLVGHLAGNLLIFLGAEHTNAYAHFLKSNIEILWGARIGLIVMFILHVYTAIKLSAENKAARPVQYANSTPYKASLASRYMLLSGITILVFVIYHLLHFTLLVPSINLTGTNFSELHTDVGHHDVYTMIITGFSQPIIAGFYILAMFLVSVHVSHAATAVFQSTGIRTVVNQPLFDKISYGLAIFFFVGFSSIPVSVLLGIIK